MKCNLLLAATIILAASAVRAESLNGTGKATYSVRATGHTVHGEAALQPFEAKLDDGKLSMAIEAKVLEMTTDKKKRDEEMYHVLHAEEHPVIRGVATDIAIADLQRSGDELPTVPITFTLAGVTVEKEAEVAAFAEDETTLTMTLRFDVSQQEHFLTPIRKFGFLKVDDTVHVEVELSLAR